MGPGEGFVLVGGWEAAVEASWSAQNLLWDAQFLLCGHTGTSTLSPCQKGLAERAEHAEST